MSLPYCLRNPSLRPVAARMRDDAPARSCVIERVSGAFLLHHEGTTLGEITKINARKWIAQAWVRGSRNSEMSPHRHLSRQDAINWLFRVSKRDPAAITTLHTHEQRLIQPAAWLYWKGGDPYITSDRGRADNEGTSTPQPLFRTKASSETLVDAQGAPVTLRSTA